MSSSDFLKNYAIAEPTIRKLYDSKLRLAILDALRDDPMRLADLRRIVGANAPNTSSKAKELEEMGLIKRIDGDFQLTPYGRTVQILVDESIRFCSTYEKFKDFWRTHETTNIPKHLWARLGDLNTSEISEPASEDIMVAEDEFLEFLGSAEKIFYGASPIYHDNYAILISRLLKKGVTIELIGNKKVLKLLAKGLGKKTIVEFYKSNKNKVFEMENMNSAVVISEKFFTLVLKTLGTDLSYLLLDADLRSFDPRAIQWGLDLFEYYKKQAKPVKLSDYL